MARVKLRCVMGCPGLKSSYREKGLLTVKVLTGSMYQGSFLTNIVGNTVTMGLQLVEKTKAVTTFGQPKFKTFDPNRL